jgi:outer membrane protein insertion porin family
MRSTIGSLALLTLCLLPSSTRLSAQAVILPKNITFTGVPAYSQAELLAFTGLKPGATSSAAEVQAAAQKLSDTGLFTDVHFQSEPQGLVYALKSMAADNLLPARFPNLVWWTNEELAAALKTRVPLYRGSIPISGNLQDNVSAALTAMLVEKGVHAKIAIMPSGAAPGATPTALSFLIESPEVRVHSVTFTSASPAMQAKLERISKDAAGQSFDQYETDSFISSRVTEVYRNDGYLEAAIQAIARSAPQVTPEAINLDLTATIREGEPYRISSVNWPGSDVIRAGDFNKESKLHPEDLASQLTLKQSLAILARAYYSKGYQDAKIQAPATLDTATHHVAYTIRVVPGDQYRIKSITAVGLTDQQRKDFNSAWHMNPGDFYDVTYLNTFLIKNTAIQSLRGYSANYKALSDPDTHLVDLTITFAKGGQLVQATD